ncbi:hypothetical protein [Micromonospora sp. NBC_00421]|uniref:hypothetical protein n=1 Tax=Micromonospora sp. NBC_00421 TaxID=2975976 RepID=UPI002E206523
MTGPEHVAEALRLADLAEQPHWDDLADPSDEHRYRMLMRAHLHANLARTAAMVDGKRYSDGTRSFESRDGWQREAWHKTFGVQP